MLNHIQIINMPREIYTLALKFFLQNVYTTQKDIKNVKYINKEFYDIIKHITKVVKISLNISMISNLSQLNQYPNLNEIGLILIGKSNKLNLKSIFSKITHEIIRLNLGLNDITLVDLSNITNVTNQDLKELGQLEGAKKLILRNCKNITTLPDITLPITYIDCRNTNIDNEGLKPLSNFKLLSIIDLSNCERIKDLSNITKATGLTDLNLNNTNITNNNLTAILQLTELTSLNLSNCKEITGSNLESILSNLKKLSYLNITNTPTKYHKALNLNTFTRISLQCLETNDKTISSVLITRIATHQLHIAAILIDNIGIHSHYKEFFTVHISLINQLEVKNIKKHFNLCISDPNHITTNKMPLQYHIVNYIAKEITLNKLRHDMGIIDTTIKLQIYWNF